MVCLVLDEYIPEAKGSRWRLSDRFWILESFFFLSDITRPNNSENALASKTIYGSYVRVTLSLSFMEEYWIIECWAECVFS